MPVPRNFDHAIDVLGGVTATARLTGHTPGAVCKWRVKHGTFPAELFLVIRQALAGAGYTAPARLFRFDAPKRGGTHDGSTTQASAG